MGSKKNICDGEWHYLAMTFDGKRVVLFVDGKQVRQADVTAKADVKPAPGPLSIGQAVDGSSRIGCDGLIDDVRLSRVIRLIRLPTGPMAVDAQTIAVWRFDDSSETILADPAWTPPPATTGEPWRRATDVDWVDARLRQMDTGPTFNATMRHPHGRRTATVYKATAIRVGDKGQGAVMFDRCQLRLAAGWTGWLNHSDRRFGLLNTPTPAGPMVFSTASGPGWAGPKGEWDAKQPATAPLPREWAKYKGLYLHGNRVVLSYTVGGVEVRESPWLETIAGQTAFIRTVEVGPSKTDLHMLAAELPDAEIAHADGVGVAASRKGEVVTMVILPGNGKEATLEPAGGSRVAVRLPASARPRRIQVVVWSGPVKCAAALDRPWRNFRRPPTCRPG